MVVDGGVGGLIQSSIIMPFALYDKGLRVGFLVGEELGLVVGVPIRQVTLSINGQ